MRRAAPLFVLLPLLLAAGDRTVPAPLRGKALALTRLESASNAPQTSSSVIETRDNSDRRMDRLCYICCFVFPGSLSHEDEVYA